MKAEPSASRASWRELVGRACVLSAVVLLVLIPAGWLGFQSHGTAGLAAAAVAAFTCWLGASVALVLTGLLRGPQTGAQGILLAALFRMGLPMAAGALLLTHGGSIARAGGLPQLLAFYLITLVTETLLALPLVRQPAVTRASRTTTPGTAAIASES